MTLTKQEAWGKNSERCTCIESYCDIFIDDAHKIIQMRRASSGNCTNYKEAEVLDTVINSGMSRRLLGERTEQTKLILLLFRVAFFKQKFCFRVKTRRMCREKKRQIVQRKH